MNLFKLIDSIWIGINLWLIPQISEHWPKYIPGRFINRLIWFIRPGIASILIASLGIVQEWITSSDEINNRILNLNGKIVLLSTSISRKFSLLLILIIYDSNSIFEKSEYSYDQNHWCPKILIVKMGYLISSIKYNKCRDGKAIKIKIIGGVKVQINSIVWLSEILISINLLFIINNIMYVIIDLIIIIIKIVWSWEKINCSISGEFLFLNLSFNQVIISKKRLFFINEF